MRDERLGFKSWSAQIPVNVFKRRLKMEESSFLSGGPSKFTFIRKTRSDIITSQDAIDINLMPPLIVKNCLPVDFELEFYDTTNVLQKIHFAKQEEKNLFCFSMAHTIIVDLIIPGFKTFPNFKIFNLEKYHFLENKIQIVDLQGRKTKIYTQIQRKNAGQRVIFYSKKLLIDSLDSSLRYAYELPPLLGEREEAF